MTLRDRAAAWLHEPLVHFLLAGAVVYAMLSGRAPDLGERRILVDQAAVSQLAARWTQSFRRAPSPGELDGLIADYVRDQAYYREALRLGLDKDDEVVVKRMRNKMLALAASEAEAASPSDIQLQELIDKNPARYAAETRFSFDQVYVGADSPKSRDKARMALAKLRGGSRSEDVSQPVPIPLHFAGEPASTVASMLGDSFVASLRDLPTGQWSGPVLSGVGLHLVRVSARTAAAKPRLEDVRQAVENDWRANTARRAEDAAYRRILEGYDVVIEMPK
ncbi:peptidylprolyl isomerase [Novosphingobium sp.]|uniref:peptidylprolyl isomerase n=1 Tax=Novosphingobium sp. TaxID=1874826 RepID=UPI0025D51133|nr:peptidylprolyl isomerase [Novosphingobium sp.]